MAETLQRSETATNEEPQDPVPLTEAEVMPAVLSRTQDQWPRVGISVSLNFPGLTAKQRSLMRDLTRNALAALAESGAQPILLDATAQHLPGPEVIGELDGLLVLGGGDIHPALAVADGAGQNPAEVPNSFGVDRRADVHTLALIRAAAEADLPTTGICRGSQLLNVAFGGTIIPDITDSTLHRQQPEGGFVNETVILLHGTRLRESFDEAQLTVRSSHHQAIDAMAVELRPAAVAADGIVEAIEHPQKDWFLGVQWHPEDLQAPQEDLATLMRAFTGRMRRPTDAAVSRHFQP